MGCIDEITINKNKLEDPEYSEGVEQCALTTEPGLYLGPKGGYAIKQHPQPIDTLTTEIMFRSRSTDGLIYSIGKVRCATVRLR